MSGRKPQRAGRLRSEVAELTVLLLVGTHKGGFLLSSGLERRTWKVEGPLFRGNDVNHLVLDQRTKPTLFACVNSSWWGSDVRLSHDLGRTWEEPESGVQFGEEAEQSVKRVWCVVPGSPASPGVLFAGADPGALFRSHDGGLNWSEVESLTAHPTREQWQPGAGGMMVHSICVHPTDPNRLHVGISAAGVFSSEDGGKSWGPRNRGVLADFLPEKYPELGQCVHHMTVHPDEPKLLYQQNHCGVYRSEDEGREWIDLSEGLPSRFGFPLQIHPHDPDTIFVVPEEGPEFRCPVDGRFAVFRSRNRGDDWERLERGLPNEHGYLHVFRQAMAADSTDPFGLYVGTSTGQVFFSADEGDSWTVLIDCLPPIYSLSSALI